MTETDKLTFQVVIHARPANAQQGPWVELGGVSYQSLAIEPASLAATPLPCSFEEAIGGLEKLPRMFTEPDGSFVWAGDGWQIDGVVWDRAGKVQYVETKGSAPSAMFEAFLQALGAPRPEFMFQLAREAIFLAHTEFLRHALTVR